MISLLHRARPPDPGRDRTLENLFFKISTALPVSFTDSNPNNQQPLQNPLSSSTMNSPLHPHPQHLPLVPHKALSLHLPPPKPTPLSPSNSPIRHPYPTKTPDPIPTYPAHLPSPSIATPTLSPPKNRKKNCYSPLTAEPPTLPKPTTPSPKTPFQNPPPPPQTPDHVHHNHHPLLGLHPRLPLPRRALHAVPALARQVLRGAGRGRDGCCGPVSGVLCAAAWGEGHVVCGGRERDGDMLFFFFCGGRCC